MTTYKIEPKIYYYTFDTHNPVARIKSGDTVVAKTRDAFGYDENRNPLPDEMKHNRPGTLLQESNPVVGPVYIDGSEPGDTLAISIDSIELNRAFAVSRQSANFGSLTGEAPGKRLLYNEPIETVWYEWKLDLETMTGSLEMPNSRLKVVEAPLHPFLGSIGVAPGFGRVENTLTPGEFGGNMDCVETAAGTLLYLPVWVEGAYLSFGDVHAMQGDGEVNGTALEVTAEVTLTIELMKGWETGWPRMENETHIMVAGSGRPLMDCVRVSQIELLTWLIEDYEFQREEAWQLMAQVGTMRIGNIVDPNYTVVSKFPKSCLPE